MDRMDRVTDRRHLRRRRRANKKLEFYCERKGSSSSSMAFFIDSLAVKQ